MGSGTTTSNPSFAEWALERPLDARKGLHLFADNAAGCIKEACVSTTGGPWKHSILWIFHDVGTLFAVLLPFVNIVPVLRTWAIVDDASCLTEAVPFCIASFSGTLLCYTARIRTLVRHKVIPLQHPFLSLPSPSLAFPLPSFALSPFSSLLSSRLPSTALRAHSTRSGAAHSGTASPSGFVPCARRFRWPTRSAPLPHAQVTSAWMTTHECPSLRPCAKAEAYYSQHRASRKSRPFGGRETGAAC